MLRGGSAAASGGGSDADWAAAPGGEAQSHATVRSRTGIRTSRRVFRVQLTDQVAAAYRIPDDLSDGDCQLSLYGWHRFLNRRCIVRTHPACKLGRVLNVR